MSRVPTAVPKTRFKPVLVVAATLVVRWWRHAQPASPSVPGRCERKRPPRHGKVLMTPRPSPLSRPRGPRSRRQPLRNRFRLSRRFPSPATTGGTTVTTTSNLVSDTCLYSHEANDDPILQPGMTGQSMAHDFFGNLSTSATSTAPVLVGGLTSCTTSADASAYWTPVLYQNDVAITPERDLIYWSGLQANNPAVTAPPPGLEIIAGDENATSPQSTKVIDWRCAEQSLMPQPVSATPINCAGTNGIELRITFPSCWNGTALSRGPTRRTWCIPPRAPSYPPGLCSCTSRR